MADAGGQCGRQPPSGGVDALVGRGERDADVAGTGGAVEGPRRHQDAPAPPASRRCRGTVLAAGDTTGRGHLRSGRVVKPASRSAGARTSRRARVPRLLLLDVRRRRPRRPLMRAWTGRRDQEARLLAHRQQRVRRRPRGHRRRSRRGSRPGSSASTASAPRAGGRGAAVDPRDEHRHRPAPVHPAEREVALVARPAARRGPGPSRPARASSAAAVMRPEGLTGELTHTRAIDGSSRSCGRSLATSRPAAGELRADGVGGVGEFGDDDGVARPRPSRVGSVATSSLDPIVGSTCPGAERHRSGRPDEVVGDRRCAATRSRWSWGIRGRSRRGERRARSTAGVSSTGVPTDRSTMPSGGRRPPAGRRRSCPTGSRAGPGRRSAGGPGRRPPARTDVLVSQTSRQSLVVFLGWQRRHEGWSLSDGAGLRRAAG